MEGHNHTYYFQAGNSVIVCAPKEDKKFYQLLDLFSRNASKGCFIANSDLPSFSRHIFPLIQDKMQIDHSDLNPAVYVPPRPSFEIYLDLPQDNLITCELKAVYKDKSFNVFENTPDEDVRDEISEQDMDHFVSACIQRVLTMQLHRISSSSLLVIPSLPRWKQWDMALHQR